jgi:hypothetical protein
MTSAGLFAKVSAAGAGARIWQRIAKEQRRYLAACATLFAPATPSSAGRRSDQLVAPS